ncbi:acyl-CoA thioester hydrolase [Pustulibacterium marinum]|uniref:Acyl-CoA thioester hydrolase n=1 Tax=Pustulibacterium marinum TaxID=1224947 RepID=A0A1I7IK18_9FLAO|nr:thioesterase family protein [Pustulibacterium marinum]SFU73263.1 acyl-CoA thioester hydrolase [Pustulibacterium marinum]
MIISNKISTRIRYAETDQMGVVYHGNYAQFLEMGRTELLRSIGVSYKNMEDNGIMLPVITMTINYKKSAYYDELIFIETSLEKLPTVKIDFKYEITNEKREVLATANVVLAFVSKDTRKPIKCPEYILKKLQNSL